LENVKKNFEVSCVNQPDYMEIIVYYRKPSGFFLIRKIIHLIRYYRALKKGIQYAASPDLIHLNVIGRQGVYALYMHLFNKIPYLITEQWSGYHLGKFKRFSWIKKWYYRMIAKKAKKIIVVSQALKYAMQKNQLFGQYEVVPNIVDELKKRNTCISKERYTAIVIADMVDEIKNISGIIKVYAKLKEKNIPLSMMVVGGGKDLRKIQQLSNQLGLQNSEIRFYGRLPNEKVLQLLDEADFLIVNSRVETFSVVCIEAFMKGIPVIATKCGGPEELINQERGILVPVDDEKALLEAMIQMINEYSSYSPDKIRRYAIQNFTYDIVGRKLKEIYDAIIR
jgi:glycosyltransferase involved in cell wall biosynthesis